MRFNYNAYDKVFPREEKPKPRIDPEDLMTDESGKEQKKEEPEKEEKKEAEDGTGTDGESDT